MNKTTQEQIEIMKHFANGGEVECICKNLENDIYELCGKRGWHFNWHDYSYRIKEQKKTITIEKWLVLTNFNYNFIVETNNIEILCTREELIKIKLLETYEVEL